MNTSQCTPSSPAAQWRAAFSAARAGRVYLDQPMIHVALIVLRSLYDLSQEIKNSVEDDAFNAVGAASFLADLLSASIREIDWVNVAECFWDENAHGDDADDDADDDEGEDS